jgi:hypothetical protein
VDIVKAILADVDQHVGEQDQADDMTIVCMTIDHRRWRRAPSESDVPGTTRLAEPGSDERS